jgi:hypothetical protein
MSGEIFKAKTGLDPRLLGSTSDIEMVLEKVTGRKIGISEEVTIFPFKNVDSSRMIDKALKK